MYNLQTRQKIAVAHFKSRNPALPIRVYSVKIASSLQAAVETNSGIFLVDLNTKVAEILVRNSDSSPDCQSLCAAQGYLLARSSSSNFVSVRLKIGQIEREFECEGRIFNLKHFRKRWFMILTTSHFYIFNLKKLRKVEVESESGWFVIQNLF